MTTKRKAKRPAGLPKAGSKAWVTAEYYGRRFKVRVMSVTRRDLPYTPSDPRDYYLVRVHEARCHTCDSYLLSAGSTLAGSWFEKVKR